MIDNLPLTESAADCVTSILRRLMLPSAIAVVAALAPLANAEQPAPQVRQQLVSGLKSLQDRVDALTQSASSDAASQKQLADVAVFAKALDWMLRHDEFSGKGYSEQAARVLEMGLKRAGELQADEPSWIRRAGVSIRGYVSKVDGSVQPYALTLPEGVLSDPERRWPLHVKLHGRYNAMNEVNFISRHEHQLVSNDQDWVQLDVYGRGNNAYRWAGETDVFEAMQDVMERVLIDAYRITVHGFSMGGAGAWHLGLHHPAIWSSVGPGAGFVDFYKYQKQNERRPVWQHQTLGIYDAIDYALNAANVPICTYGGENDAQLVASTSVTAKAASLGVDVKLLIGPGMGHKFHPDSFKQFMAFHRQHSANGRVRTKDRRRIRFTTRTLKYNQCDWLAVEEVQRVYEPSTVDARILQEEQVQVSTENVGALRLNSGVAAEVVLDGGPAIVVGQDARSQPYVYFQKTNDAWKALTSAEAARFGDNPHLHKRHMLQGPIDDAFMEPFVCVSGSGTPTSRPQHEWAAWTLHRFQQEFDKWMRAEVPLIADAKLSSEIIDSKHLVLFGDPSSNAVLAKILPQLPVEWTEDALIVGDQKFDTANHGLSMIFPNPLNPRRYVVINSGHTFHEKDFRSSNAWLFPRLGDIAVTRFSPTDDGTYDEEVVWAANFDGDWKLPE